MGDGWESGAAGAVAPVTLFHLWRLDFLGSWDEALDRELLEAGKVLGVSAAGTYDLDGDEAVYYSRLRSIDTDRKRTGRQRAVLNAIALKLRKSSASTMVDLLDTVLPLVTTNFSKAELLAQVAKAPKYLSMSIHEDIIPHVPYPLSTRDGKEVLILNWDEEDKYIHDLLYPDIIPQSAEKE